jgi:hypothetical protein
MNRWLMAAPAFLLLSCSQSTPDPAGFRVVFEDQEAGRLAVCGLEGGSPQYITPDSLLSSGPVTDSTRATVYFMAHPRSQPDALQAVYAVDTRGTELRQVAEMPLSVQDIQITPDGSLLLFLGKYPDQEHVRAYLMRVGESGFQAVTPDNKSAHDPAMAPGGLNFVWHDGSHSDTLFVSSLQHYLTLPIFVFPYTQVSISWPDGRAFAAVCGPHRRGLCYNMLQSPEGQEVRKETVLIPEEEGVEISQPAFHPDGLRIIYVRSEIPDGGASRLCVIDRNSLKITRIPVDCRRPSHPAWVR